MSLRSAANRRPTSLLFALLLVGAPLLFTAGSAFAQQVQPKRSRVRLDPRQAANMRGVRVTAVAQMMNHRLDEWRRAWSRDKVKRLVDMYTPNAMLIPPGQAPVARGLEEIQVFFEEFLPMVGDVWTSLVDFDAGSRLSYARGRFFYATGRKQKNQPPEAAVSGTIFTVFRREGQKWKIRLQLFMVEPPEGAS